jgi:hypothetical protein
VKIWRDYLKKKKGGIMERTEFNSLRKEARKSGLEVIERPNVFEVSLYKGGIAIKRTVIMKADDYNYASKRLKDIVSTKASDK